MSYNIHQIAELLHKEYELKAHQIGWATNEKCRHKPFDELPPYNKAVMLHVAEWVFNEIEDERERAVLKEQKLQILFLNKINKLRKELYIDADEDLEFFELIKKEAIRLGLDELEGCVRK